MQLVELPTKAVFSIALGYIYPVLLLVVMAVGLNPQTTYDINTTCLGVSDTELVTISTELNN